MTTMPSTYAQSRPYVSRHTRRRPWWLGALDRELAALGRHVGQRTRMAVAYTAVLALIYLGTNGGMG